MWIFLLSFCFCWFLSCCVPTFYFLFALHATTCFAFQRRLVLLITTYLKWTGSAFICFITLFLHCFLFPRVTQWSNPIVCFIATFLSLDVQPFFASCVFFFCIFFVFRLIIERKRERARKADSRKRNIWFEKTNDKYRRRIVLGFVFRLLLCGYVLFLFILHMFPSFAFYLSSSCLLICVRD